MEWIRKMVYSGKIMENEVENIIKPTMVSGCCGMCNQEHDLGLSKKVCQNVRQFHWEQLEQRG